MRKYKINKRNVVVWLVVMLFSVLSISGSNPESIEKTVYAQSMKIVSYLFPDSGFLISDTLYNFSGREFASLQDKETQRKINEYYEDSVHFQSGPRYSPTIKALAEEYGTRKGDRQYTVKFSRPYRGKYRGMISCEVTPGGGKQCAEKTVILFRYRESTGEIYFTTKLTVPCNGTEK